MAIDLSNIRLEKGAHGNQQEGGCVMEWVSVFAGLSWSDAPSCTDPVVAAYVRALNDLMPDDQRQRLIPYIPRLAATSNGVSQQTRAFMAADFVIHVLAPIALRAKGLETQAVKLESLAKVDSVESANAAADVANNAAANAYAADAAAYAADAAAYAAADAAAYAAADAAAYAANATYAAANAYAADAAAYAADAAAYAAADAAANAANATYAAANATYATYAAANATYATYAAAAAAVWDRAMELLDQLIEAKPE